ncbi:hypothetical protein SCA6_002950 [Theobroma cacao]
MIQERASLPIISLQPVVAGAARKTSRAVGQATKTIMNIIYRGEFSSEHDEDSGIEQLSVGNSSYVFFQAVFSVSLHITFPPPPPSALLSHGNLPEWSEGKGERCYFACNYPLQAFLIFDYGFYDSYNAYIWYTSSSSL